MMGADLEDLESFYNKRHEQECQVIEIAIHTDPKVYEDTIREYLKDGWFLSHIKSNHVFFEHRTWTDDSGSVRSDVKHECDLLIFTKTHYYDC